MRTNKNKEKRNGRSSKILTALLILVMLVQTVSLPAAAMVGQIASFGGSYGSITTLNPSGISSFDSKEVAEQLRQDFLSSLRKDLVTRIEEHELTGYAGLIITFSDDSLITEYTNSSYSTKMTYNDYKKTSTARKFVDKLTKNQNKVLDKLLEEGLIDEVKYNYVHMLDGAYVHSTYEAVAKICEIEGVERVMVSRTYEPLNAVENPVDVYGTGIFNSSSVSYTGKGTIVAVLDTGCDYAHSAFTTHQVVDPLYDRDDIAALLDQTMAYQLTSGLEAREVYYGNITGNKIAFGYDYADKDADIMPFENSHGTHVAGIIAGKDDNITGVAIDAQIAVMKVFSDYEQGAKDGDIIAALEDSIVLGVDAINMSLGTSSGFSFESDPMESYTNELYSRIEQAGISLVVAASNDYSSGYGSENGNTNKTDNPDSATVGSPATYESSFAVASISGKKDNYMYANGDHVVFFNKSFSTSAEEYDFFALMGIKEGQKVTFEYVTVPGVGLPINYAGIDVNGKIALVERGDITFEEKVQYAQEAGAIAIIVYNNVYGDIVMTIGNDAKIPAVSIGRDDGELLASRASGTFEFDLANVAGPFMSGFSSWGPTPDLKLKPEITAHGGNILSAVVGGEYDELSGTSMAAPNMCGIVVLIRQYIKEKYAGQEMTDTAMRDMVNQLTMSTATIAYDKYNRPYSPRKQGAGIADITKATTTSAYLYVDGIGKTKLELGDDPTRSGVYTMTINLKNTSDSAVSYKLGSIVMTESVSTAEPEYVAEIAYLLSGTTDFKVSGGTLEEGVVTVAGGATAAITATITLSAEDKSYLNSTFENGMYVEGFLTFDSTEESGVDLNAPFLAFYGNWGEAPIFDLDYYEVETEAHNNAIDDDDKIKADYYATTPLGTYYYDYVVPLGTYLYNSDESIYDGIPATQERAAISYYYSGISAVYGVFTGLLRGAKELEIVVKNVSTGEVVYSETQYNCPKAHYAGGPRGYMAKLDLQAVTFGKNANGEDTGTVLGFNNCKFEVTMNAKLDWNGGENASDSYSFSFYIDYEPPTIVDAQFRTEYDKSRKENRYYVDAYVYDNHYAMSVRPIVIYEITKEDGEITKTFSSLSNEPIPVYQQNKGERTKVTIEITDYLDLISNSSMPNGLTVYLDDYAMNSAVCYIPFPETDSDDLEFADSEITLDIHETRDLTTAFYHKDSADPVNPEYLSTLQWSSSDENVVAIHAGQIEAKGPGTALIRVTSDSWVTKSGFGEKVNNTNLYKTLIVHVTENEKTDDPNSSLNVEIEALKFASYKTLFAFNNDIDWSAIGETGSVRYFGGKYSLEFYPSEQIQLYPELEPWNMPEDKIEFIWSSSNPRVATVDNDGVVTAESEGKARITLQVKIDGKTSILAARLSVEVKSEFIIENRELVAYKGKGGDVVIPDDEGILYIGSFAFSHFEIDHKKEVEKDEHGYYDIDEKKTPLGNNTVTSVVIPEGVETIEKYAFYNCSALTDVVLPESCKNIATSAFEKCKALENVNFDNVKVIANRAFYNCSSLGSDQEINLSSVYAIGNDSFYNNALTSVSLDGLSRIGEGCFRNCSKLETVKLGERTRVGKNMFKNTAVKSIIIYSDIVGDGAFTGCDELTSVVFENELTTYLGVSAFADCTKLESVEFNGVLEEIASLAFDSCTALETVELPNCDVVIGDFAFAGSGLKTLVFDTDTRITSLGSEVFANVGAFAADVSNSSVYKLSDGAIYTKDGKTLVLVLGADGTVEFNVPADVTTIGSGAFSSLVKLETVSFADGSKLTSIGNDAFYNCKSLSTITLPANDIELGSHAFAHTPSLKSIDLSSVKYVGTYAFASSALSSLSLTKENVEIADFAFAGISTLTEITLGNNANIGNYAFANSGVVRVDLNGDATVSRGAFENCAKLNYFDFEDVTGAIGDRAFYKCVLLTDINAPKITAIGDYAFSYCDKIASLNAPLLESVGDYAFTLYSEKENTSFMTANMLTEINLPSLKVIGDYAFFGSRYVKTLDLSNVEQIGKSAFYYGSSLTKVTLSENLTELPYGVFANCVNLAEIDLSNIETIGDYALAGVPFYGKLELPSVKYIGETAFAEVEGRNLLTEIVAPELLEIGKYAFGGCKKLSKLTAPKLETIAEGAFALTNVSDFMLTESIVSIDKTAFYSAAKFDAFYALDENGKKIYNVDLGNYMINDGVLYKSLSNDEYILTIYPVAKRDAEYTVADGTTLIDFAAASGNKYIEKIILPSSLKAIGNLAFNECKNLKTVVFTSYYAPTLQGSMSKTESITIENVENYPGFEDLYKYDFFWRSNNEVSLPYFYSMFKDTVGSENAQGLTMVIPDNCVGYDSLIYNAYFTTDTETSGITAGKYAVAFIEAVKKLPAVCDRFDKLLIEDAIGAYNALLGHSEESVFVSDSYIERYNKALSEYNVNVATNKIAHLFDMDMTEYTFNKVKDARDTYLALTVEEQANVTNAALLEEKIADLNEIYGREVDFTLSYQENLPKEDTPTVEPTPTEGLDAWVIVLIVVGSVLVLAGGAVTTIIFIKKKRTQK